MEDKEFNIEVEARKAFSESKIKDPIEGLAYINGFIDCYNKFVKNKQ